MRAIAATAGTEDDLLLAIGQTRIYDCIEDPVTLSEVAGRLLGASRRHNDLRVEAGARFAQALSSFDQGDMQDLASTSERYTRGGGPSGRPSGTKPGRHGPLDDRLYPRPL